MTKETMTIHKALSELKTIDARIGKAIRDCKFAVVNKHSNEKIGGMTIDDYRREQENLFKSACDLINRRNAIKRAVMQSNAVAKVNINGVEYTVAEAIDMKNHGMDGRRELLRQMIVHLSAAETSIERYNGDELQNRADAYIKNLYGNQTDLSKLTGEMRSDREKFIAQQTSEMVTPMGMDLRKTIKEFEDEINSFMVEVDAALSVSNATTTIEIEY